MNVYFRIAGGKDPLGDVALQIADSEAGSPENALYRALEQARQYNKGARRVDGSRIEILHCGDVLLEVRTGKLYYLVGKQRIIKPQPELDMPSKTEPRLL